MTRDQKRAQLAFAKVEAVHGKSFAKDYGRLCRRLPTLILQAGLCQALAFLQAKAGNKPESPHARVLQDLATIVDSSTDGAAFANKARTGPLPEYRRLTLEALHCSHYLKRYAEAFGLGDPAEVPTT